LPVKFVKNSINAHLGAATMAGLHRMIRRLWIIPAAFSLVLLTLLPAKSQGPEVFQLAAFNYPPFYYEENGEVHGIAVDLTLELFHRLDKQVVIKMYPIKRALSYLKSGNKDGVMILIKTPQRETFATFTDPVMTVRGLIWSSAEREGGAVNFKSLDDLRPYVVGVTRGYSYGHEFDEILKTIRTDVANADLYNYKKLISGRIDIFPGNEIVAKGLFKLHPELKGKVVHSDRSFIEWVLHMGISKKSRLVSMIPEINRVLAEMKAEGVIDVIVDEYTQ